MTSSSIHLGRAVHEIRIARGLSQKELATKAGIGISFLSKLERGERGVSHQVAEDIADALEVPVTFLYVLARSEPNEVEIQLQKMVRESVGESNLVNSG